MKRLPNNAQEIMIKRYALRDDKGKPSETPVEILERVARVVAEAEDNFSDEGVSARRAEAEKKFLGMLKDFRFVPNGRTLANAGLTNGQLANCFVLPIDDEMGKTEDGIFSILRKAVLVLQSGGGVGFSFGRVRPKGDKAGKGKATGAVSFLKVFDTAFWVIGQGGGRRSACMAVLPVHHPDIWEFIKCKEKEGVIEHFNISVGITDKFMEAVDKDKPFDLINPRNGEVWETIRARDLFEDIVEFAHHNGEPGVLFLDAANRENPVPNQYELEATNPCVTGDTLVATPSGWKRADSIKKGEKICTVLGEGRVETVEINEEVEVFAVHLSDGGVMKVTAAHQFHARDTKTKFFDNKRVDALQMGDWIRVSKGVVPDNEVRQGSVKLDDKEYGFLVGVLVGDGCYTPSRLSKNIVRVSSHADEEEWNNIIKKIFEKIGCKKMYSYVNKNSRSLMMDPKPGKVAADWVKSLPLKPAVSRNKELPIEYINSNKEFLLGLLDGMFSTDGSVDLSSNHPLVRFHTSSKKLADQLRLILLFFGIHGRVIESVRKEHDIDGRVIRNDRPKYDVIITSRSVGRFYEQIQMSHPEKQRRMKEAVLKCNFTGGNWAAKVLKIESLNKKETVYDLFEPESDTWITEGYVSRGCGEQFLGPYENCCMASVNLSEHVMKSVGHRVKGKEELYDHVVDWEKLGETVRWTVRWLDNVVEANAYVGVVPELQEAAHRNRRIGVSIMGLADMMYMMGVRYGSDQAVDLAGQLMEFIRYESMRESVDLARERGAFPGMVGSRYDFQQKSVVHAKGRAGSSQQSGNSQNSVWEAPRPIRKYRHEFGRPKVDWNGLEKGLKKYGIRNSCQATIQPTGAIATISGLEGYGCEPVFALSYIMKTHEGAAEKGKDWHELYYQSGLFKEALERWNKLRVVRSESRVKKNDKVKNEKRKTNNARTHDSRLTTHDSEKLDVKKVFEEVRKKGTCQELEVVPEEIAEVFVVSGDIKVMEHVRMQAALQAFVDNAISKTINFPAGATTKDVWQAYMDGWKLGLKGMTVYVTGSRDVVVLETEMTRKARQKSTPKGGQAEVRSQESGEDEIESKAYKSDEPFVANGNGVMGKTLKKVKPEDMVCDDCGANMVLQEGCATCPACGSSHCKV